MVENSEQDEDVGSNNPEYLKNIVSSVVEGIGTVLIAYILTLLVLYLVSLQVSFDSLDTVPQVLLYVLEFSVLGSFTLLISYIMGPYNYIDARILNKRHIITIIGLIFVMLTFQVFFNGLIQIIGVETAENTVVDSGLEDPTFYLYMIPVMVLFVGPIEEFIFRGVIQDTFTEKINFKIGLIVASSLFGLIHLTSVMGATYEAMLYVISSGILGIMLGYYYQKTRNIVVPMVAHGVYNSILMLILYLISVA
jgi:membrane protease YdiL (CAAX protease family)